MEATLIDRIFIFIARRLWRLYCSDKNELYRKNLSRGEALFNAERFITWLVNYEFRRSKQK